MKVYLIAKTKDVTYNYKTINLNKLEVFGLKENDTFTIDTEKELLKGKILEKRFHYVNTNKELIDQKELTLDYCEFFFDFI